MRILSILNLSNRERPGCDSGVIFHRLLFSRLAGQGWHCVVASPIDLKISGVSHVHVEVGSSKYDVRFRFDWDGFSRLLLAERPDILFVHQVELTSNFRALLLTLGLDTKLITYCHYWPVLQIADNGEIEWDESLNHGELAEVILFRILGALRCSDHFFVTSVFAKRLLLRAVDIYNARVDHSKIHILSCPADPEFLSNVSRRYSGTRRILYNHRLYKQYGTEFFLELVSEFARSNVTFVVTDFFSLRNDHRKHLEPHVDLYRDKLKSMKNVILRSDGHIRSVYRKDIVENVDLGLGPFRLNANWSMGAVDCLGLGIPVVCPSIASFPEFVPDELLFGTMEEATQLIWRLFTDNDFWKLCSEKAQSKAARFSADNACSEFVRFLTE